VFKKVPINNIIAKGLSIVEDIPIKIAGAGKYLFNPKGQEWSLLDKNRWITPRWNLKRDLAHIDFRLSAMIPSPLFNHP
jgi:hypothetical protein